MTEEELKEQIQNELARYGAGLLTHKLDGSVSECEAEARKILTLIKQAGYVRLSDDQSLPPFAYISNGDLIAKTTIQQDMLKAGYRKVEL